MKLRSSLKLGATLAGLASLTACGLEGLLVNALSSEPEYVAPEPTPTAPPPALVDVCPTVSLGEGATWAVYDVTGVALETTVTDKGEGCVELAFPFPDTGMVQVAVTSGSLVLKALTACLQPGVAASLTLGKEETTATLAIESLGVTAFLSDLMGDDTFATAPTVLASYASDELIWAYDTVLADLEAEAVKPLADMVGRLVDQAGSADVPMFAAPVAGPELLTAAFLSDAGVDYTGDEVEDAGPEAFVAAAKEAAGYLLPLLRTGVPQKTLEGCTNADGNPCRWLPVIFTAHTEADGLTDGGCASESMCKSTTIVCDPGDTLWITGGVHESSPVSAAEVDDALGNWAPNTMPMYDDGTHGDAVASDSIWTTVIYMPETMRVTYKYTFGVSGKDWNKTEEWPGFNRQLEIIDNNGDGYIWREDVVGDEGSNKEDANTYTGAPETLLAWDSDLDGDGYPESQESPSAMSAPDPVTGEVSLEGVCVANATRLAWVHPTLVTRNTSTQCRP